MNALGKLALMLVAALPAAAAKADGPCCDHCGCRQNCRKVCRLVCETKKDKKVEYSCECEDFCVPGPSERCGTKCECDDCGNKRRVVVWKPTCARVRTRAKLIKTEVPVEKKVYNWVVEEICCGCGNCLSQAKVDAPPPGSEVIQASAQTDFAPVAGADPNSPWQEPSDLAAQSLDTQPRSFWGSLFGR